MAARRTVLAAALASVTVCAFAAPGLALAQAAASPPAATGRFTSIKVPGAVQTMAEMITDSGLIVGCFDPSKGPERGFADSHGRFMTIRDPAAGSKSQIQACVLGANDKGVLVGYYASASGTVHGFLDNDGRFSAINVPAARGPLGTLPVDVNDAGVIVGQYWVRSRQYGFILKAGKFTTVRDTAAGKAAVGTLLTGIADNGTASGAYVTAKGVAHGFLYHAGKFTALTVPGTAESAGKGAEPVCISKRSGLVVGIFWKASSPAHPTGFTYQRGKYHTLRDPAGTDGTEPQCGNDSGRIVGVYLTGNGVQHGFEFTPRA